MTQKNIDVEKLIIEFKEALGNEIEALKREYSGEKFLIRNGELVRQGSGLFLYKFFIDTDLPIPDDSPVEVNIGTKKFTANIVSTGFNEIILAFDEDLGTFITEAVIRITPWFLLEQLKKRFEEIQTKKLSFNFQNALKLFGFLEPTSKSKETGSKNLIKRELNDMQVEALSKTYLQEITFIWGPPGTGKTKTIATIIDSLISINNKKILLTTHTNVALDKVLVKLAKILSNKALLDEGRIVRYGTPCKGDESLKKMAFKEILANKKAPLEEKIEKLEKEKTFLEKKIKLLEEAIALNKKIDQLRQEVSVLQNEFKKIEGSLFSLRNQLQSVKKDLQEMKKKLEEAKNAGFLTRLFKRLDPKKIEQQISEKQAEEQRLLINENKILKDLEELKKKIVLSQKEFNYHSKNLEQLLHQLGLTHNNEINEKFQKFQSRINLLKQEINFIRKQIDNLSQEIINNCYVLGTTLSKLYLDPLLYHKNYDVLVLDEASMAPLPAVFFAAGLINEKFVITGDFRQLPPIAIAESDVVKKWLKRDLFEQAGIVARLSKGNVDKRLIMLTKQYRMHPAIVEIINASMYDGKLETPEEVISEVSEITAKEPFSNSPVVLCDTSEINPWCSRPSGMYSHFNIYQAVLCCKIAKRAIQNGVKNIGIITPYKAQARLISKLLKDAEMMDSVQVATVHRFQGEEKDLIIFDLVDGPPLHYPGKLLRGSFPESEASKLINVAVTRAKGKFIVVANYLFFTRKLNKTDAIFMVLDFIYRNGKIVDSRDILPSYFDELILEKSSSLQSLQVPYEWSVWNEKYFYDQFEKDLYQAKENVIIFSPFITKKRIDCFVNIFRFLIDKGVKLYIVTRPVEEQVNKSEFRSLLKYLEQAGVKLIYRKKLHEKAAFIDDKVCWLGSLNILSHSDSSEYMLSIRTKESILQLHQFFDVASVIGIEKKRKEQDEKRRLWKSLQDQILTLMHEFQCPVCGAPLILYPGKYGLFLACQQRHKTGCRGLINVPRKIIEDAVKTLEIKCPQCKTGFMQYQVSKHGPYLKCQRFPDCRYTIHLGRKNFKNL